MNSPFSYDEQSIYFKRRSLYGDLVYERIDEPFWQDWAVLRRPLLVRLFEYHSLH